MPKRRRQKPKKRTPTTAPKTQEWFTIRRILDERLVNGRIEYLVDWDDNIHTGEPYPNSWSDGVTEAALEDWEEEKEGRAQQTALSEAVARDNARVDPQSPQVVVDGSDDDIRPPNWRRGIKRLRESPVSRPGSSSANRDYYAEKRVKADSYEESKGQSAPSVTSAWTGDFEPQSPESLHSEDFNRLRGQRVSIQLNKPSQFDPSEYQSVTNTQGSSQLISELEEEDRRAILASELSQRTIPDSQESSGLGFTQPLSKPPLTIPDSSNPEPERSSSRCCIPVSSLVISESQDHSAGCPVSGTVKSQSQNSALVVNTSDSFPKYSAPDTETGNLDIPSRQPEQSQSQRLGSPDLSTSALGSPTNQPIIEASPNKIFDAPTPVNASSGHIFLTQPQHSQDSFTQGPTLNSSGQRATHRTDNLSVGDPAESWTVPCNEKIHDNAVYSLRESQAAQVVSRDFDPFSDKITNSDGTSHKPESDSEHIDQEKLTGDLIPHRGDYSPTVSQISERRDTRGGEQGLQATIEPWSDDPEHNPKGQREPRKRAREPSLADPALPQPPEQPASRAQIPKPVVTNSSQRRVTLKMEEPSDSGQPSSAADELRSLFDFGGATLPTDGDSTVDAPPQDISGSLPEQPTSSIVAADVAAAPEVVVGVSEPDIHLQPALAVEPWKPEVIASVSQDMPPPSISPASIMPGPNASAVDTMRDLVYKTFAGSSNSITGALMGGDLNDIPQGTISPADISHSLGPGDETNPLLMPLSDRTTIPSVINQSSDESITMGQVTQPPYAESSTSSQDESTLSEHIVTLPFQASRRPYYDETLLEYRRDAEKFSEVFNSEVYKEPDEALVERIDDLFSRLFNICDYPQDLVGTKLEDLPASDQAKYSNDANPKFNFMYELLQAIEQDTEILVLARTPELLRLLYAQTRALEVECACQNLHKTESTFKNSAAKVTLALSTEDFDPFKFDAVIGFDHTFNSSPIPKRLLSRNPREKGPLVLQLVTTHSIEHIFLHVPQDISPLEKKNALLSGIVEARKLIDDPDRGYGDPHKVAEVFSNFLNGFTETVSWEPQSIPDDVLDFFLNTQSLTQGLEENRSIGGGGLKRKLPYEDSDDAKRMRVLPILEPIIDSNDPPLPYALRGLLEFARPKDVSKERASKISVPLALLDVLAEKVSEYQRQAAFNDREVEYKAIIDRLDKQVKEYARTTNKIFESKRKALQDRSSFEKAKLKADEAAKAQAEAAQKEADKKQKRIEELEATVARLTAVPGSTDEGESPLAKSEKLLSESEEKVRKLEKRLENAQEETNYIRSLYQDVHSRASELGNENKSLREQNEDLQLKASENLKQIHQIQASNTNDENRDQISALKFQLRERDIELFRLREEVTLRNGRPSTRQASVPRSPRMGMISPRPGRGLGSSASRGTSPAPVPGYEGNGPGAIPGVQFMGQQSGNGRWGHLRD